MIRIKKNFKIIKVRDKIFKGFDSSSIRSEDNKILIKDKDA